MNNKDYIDKISDSLSEDEMKKDLKRKEIQNIVLKKIMNEIYNDINKLNNLNNQIP